MDSVFNVEQGVADSLPGGRRVVDTVTGTFLSPFAWRAPFTATDPLDVGGVSGIDFTGVTAELIQGHLVVRGTLKTWLNTDVDNQYEILLDTDMNAATA